jgi:hypothetical protein
MEEFSSSVDELEYLSGRFSIAAAGRLRISELSTSAMLTKLPAGLTAMLAKSTDGLTASTLNCKSP